MSARRRVASLAVVASIAVPACGGTALGATPTRPSSSALASSSTASVRQQATASTLQDRVAWLVAQFNAPEADPAMSEGFAPSFFAAFSVDDLLSAIVAALTGGTDWTITDVSATGAVSATVTITSGQGAQLRVAVSVEPDGAHRITDLQFNVVVFPPDTPVTPAAFDRALRSLGPEVSFGLYDVTHGSCRLVHGVDDHETRPIGSAFKLWILGALATEIAAGRASWDETMPVTAALISTPAGVVANTPVGTLLTLRRFAELMISISDNSATDHLLHRLGRRTVEQEMRRAGVAHPGRNTPLLSTRELFLLKYGRTLPAARYLAMTPPARRQALDSTLAGVGLVDDFRPDADTTVPTEIDTIEWFATPLDECRTQLRLAALATRPGLEPVAAILRLNPGSAFGAEWTDVRFKGGSEAGVAYGTWRLARANGHVYILAGGVADPTAPVNGLRAMSTVTGGLRLLDR